MIVTDQTKLRLACRRLARELNKEMRRLMIPVLDILTSLRKGRNETS